jgi:hypothetical protein
MIRGFETASIGFVKSPISAEASLRVFIALHPVAIALNLNFLQSCHSMGLYCFPGV